VSPPSGNQGQVLDVVIVGVNLDGTTGIDFGAGITVNSFAVQSAESVAASIAIDSSALLGTRDVAVITVDGTAVSLNAFSVTAEAPTIADIAPRSGKVGQALSVTITGANLGSASSVNLGAGVVVEGFVAAPDQITLNIVVSGEASLGTRNVSVTTAGGTATLDGGFVVYRLPPGVIGVSPASGKPGQTLDVVISGVNFTGTTSVDFGIGVRVNRFRVDSDMQITANITILDGAEGGLRNVDIETEVGSVSFPSGFNLSVDSASRHSSPVSSSDGSSSWLWVPMVLGGLVVAVSLIILLVVRRKRDGAEQPPSAS
jgi:large repetitive protein